MVAINLENFGGMVPLKDARLLPNNMATYSANCWLYNGTLKGFKSSTALYNVTGVGTTKKVYRIPNDMTPSGPHDYSGSTWLEFTDPDTDLVKAPSINDQYQRFYWCSPSVPPRFNTFARIQAGNTGVNTSFLLGQPAAITAPAVAPTGGASTTALVRVYLYTWVNVYGEEGPPSPPTLATGVLDSVWTLILTAPTAGAQTDRALVAKTRLYRSVTSAAGVATYSLVAELPVATLAFADTIPDTTVTGQGTLPSTFWTPPPALSGFVAMPNGMIAGWLGRDIWFCEPYHPHAWPVNYTISVENPIVGLGVLGTTLFIATTGNPYTASGVNPASVSLSSIKLTEPCVSRASIVSTIQGVYYASKNGLVMASPGQVTSALSQVIDYRDWRTLLDPWNIRAVKYQGGYMAFPGPASLSQQGFLSEPQSDNLAFNLITQPNVVQSLTTDLWTGDVLVLSNDQVMLYDDFGSATSMAYEWHSKEFHFVEPMNLVCMRVFFNTLAGSPTLTTEVIQPTTLTSTQYGFISAYADGNLIWSRELRFNGQLFRMPSGRKSEVWQFVILARVEIRSVQIASSVKELGSV